MSPPRSHSKWSDIAKIVLVVLAVNVAVYGCSRQPAAKPSTNDRTRALETRCSKLESDFRTVTHARDKARAEAARLESEVAALRKEVNARVTTQERDELAAQLKEAQAQRDELRAILATRTTERNQLQDRAERLRKGLQAMLEQDRSSSVSAPAATPTSRTSAPAGRPQT